MDAADKLVINGKMHQAAAAAVKPQFSVCRISMKFQQRGNIPPRRYKHRNRR